MALKVLFSGFALIVAGLTVEFGPLALVGSGVVLVAIALLVDWEALSEAARPPS